MKIIISFFMICSLASCASWRANEIESGPSASGKIQCKKEVPLGSHLPVNRCRTEAQIRKDREDAKVLRQQRTQRY